MKSQQCSDCSEGSDVVGQGKVWLLWFGESCHSDWAGGRSTPPSGKEKRVCRLGTEGERGDLTVWEQTVHLWQSFRVLDSFKAWV